MAWAARPDVLVWDAPWAEQRRRSRERFVGSSRSYAPILPPTPRSSDDGIQQPPMQMHALAGGFVGHPALELQYRQQRHELFKHFLNRHAMRVYMLAIALMSVGIILIPMDSSPGSQGDWVEVLIASSACVLLLALIRVCKEGRWPMSVDPVVPFCVAAFALGLARSLNLIITCIYHPEGGHSPGGAPLRMLVHTGETVEDDTRGIYFADHFTVVMAFVVMTNAMLHSFFNPRLLHSVCLWVGYLSLYVVTLAVSPGPGFWSSESLRLRSHWSIMCAVYLLAMTAFCFRAYYDERAERTIFLITSSMEQRNTDLAQDRQELEEDLARSKEQCDSLQQRLEEKSALEDVQAIDMDCPLEEARGIVKGILFGRKSAKMSTMKALLRLLSSKDLFQPRFMEKLQDEMGGHMGGMHMDRDIAGWLRSSLTSPVPGVRYGPVRSAAPTHRRCMSTSVSSILPPSCKSEGWFQDLSLVVQQQEEQQQKQRRLREGGGAVAGGTLASLRRASTSSPSATLTRALSEGRGLLNSLYAGGSFTMPPGTGAPPPSAGGMTSPRGPTSRPHRVSMSRLGLMPTIINFDEAERRSLTHGASGSFDEELEEAEIGSMKSGSDGHHRPEGRSAEALGGVGSTEHGSDGHYQPEGGAAEALGGVGSTEHGSVSARALSESDKDKGEQVGSGGRTSASSGQESTAGSGLGSIAGSGFGSIAGSGLGSVAGSGLGSFTGHHVRIGGVMSASSTGPPSVAGADDSVVTGTGSNLGVDAENPAAAPQLHVLDQSLKHLGVWDLDVFRIEEESGGHAILCVGIEAMLRFDLVKELGLNLHKLQNFLLRIEGSMKANPYHCRTHVADATANMVHLLMGPPCNETGGLAQYLKPLETLAAITAVLIHDFGHPGVSNDFLANISHPLALRYNDRSILESFHLASAFELLAGEECELDFLDPEMSLQERKEFRHLVIDIVMATDLQQHFTILQRFRQLVVPDTGVLPSSGLSAEARSITLQMAMKCCDLGHLAKSRPTHVRWTKAIEEEFFLQGDEERHLGLPVSPFMDRFNANLAKSQVGFFQVMAACKASCCRCPCYPCWHFLLQYATTIASFSS
eukprot:jgi/Mesvir1/4032/Mv25939-RA.3